MSTDTERRELVRPDATVAYWVSGPEESPVVVLLHGATLDHHAWAPQVGKLAARYRVAVPDLRGHGESSLSDAFRFDDAVDDVAALLDEVDTGVGLVLGGLSLGGNIAQEIVHRDPDRVDALVVADSTCNTAARPEGDADQRHVAAGGRRGRRPRAQPHRGGGSGGAGRHRGEPAGRAAAVSRTRGRGDR
jgi:pimeloyl-ACP methyl ester carboxylesterase